MRIIYLHQYFTTPDMAGGTRSYEMARRLVSKEHEVHMITSWRDSSEHDTWFETVEAGIHVHWLPVPYSNVMNFANRIRAFFYFAWKAARKAASIRADVVFATSTPLTIAIPGVYAARRLRIPMVFEVRDLWPEVPIALGVLKTRFTVSAARKLERFAYRNATRIVALAPGMKRGVCATGYPDCRVDIIPNGCDFDIFQQAQHREPKELPKVVANGGQHIILYIGTIGSANGVDYIVRLAYAINQAADSDATIRFVVIGDGKEKMNVEALADELGVLNDTIFFLGEKKKSEIPAWLFRCNATLMTYDGPEAVYRDSVSNKFFDSLAAGRPVLANFSGFSTKVAENYEAGKIISRSDLAEAAKIVRETLRETAWLVSAGKNAKLIGEQIFARDRLAEELERTLRVAIKKNECGQSCESKLTKSIEQLEFKGYL